MAETMFNTFHQQAVPKTNDFLYRSEEALGATPPSILQEDPYQALIVYPRQTAPRLAVDPATCMSTRATPDTNNNRTWNIMPPFYQLGQCYGNSTIPSPDYTNIASMGGFTAGCSPDIMASNKPTFHMPQANVRYSGVTETPRFPPLSPVDQTEIVSVNGFDSKCNLNLMALSSPLLELPHSFQMGHDPRPISSEGLEVSQEYNSPLSSQDSDQSVSQQCYAMWKQIPMDAVVVTGSDRFVPQMLYRPFTQADQERYLEKVSLSPPIIFVTKEPHEWGIALVDAIKGTTARLIDKDEYVLQDCGPSVTIRINWPGYSSFKRQISSRDWSKARDPITKARLAKSLAKTTNRFIEKMSKKPLDMDADRRWRVGAKYIRMEDLILVSLHHVSQGSWQPHFRLRRDLV